MPAMSSSASLGMDDERQAPFRRAGLDVDPQALLLRGLRLGRVVVVESGFADTDELSGERPARRGRRRSPSVRSPALIRMGAGCVEHGRLGFRQPAHHGLEPELRADRDHPVHPGVPRATDECGKLPVEVGEVEVTMAVCDPGGCGHGCRSGPGHSPRRFIQLEQDIKDDTGGVKVDPEGVGGAFGAFLRKRGPGPGGIGAGGEAREGFRLGGGCRWPRRRPGSGARKPRKGCVDQAEKKVAPGFGSAATGGAGEVEGCAAVELREGRHEADQPVIEVQPVMFDQCPLPGRRNPQRAQRAPRCGPKTSKPAPSRAAPRSSGESGSKRRVRQRERMVGRRPDGL